MIQHSIQAREKWNIQIGILPPFPKSSLILVLKMRCKVSFWDHFNPWTFRYKHWNTWLLKHFENLNSQFNYVLVRIVCVFKRVLQHEAIFGASIEWDNCGKIEEVLSLKILQISLLVWWNTLGFFLPDRAVMTSVFGWVYIDELKMLICTRSRVTRRAILPGMASMGTTKLIQEIPTKRQDGK